jgi:RNA polymerase-binding transcription factor DksA
VTRKQRPARPVALKGTRHFDSNRVVDRTAEAAALSAEFGPDSLLTQVQWDQLDRSQVPTWIELVRDGERQLRQLRSRLEALQEGDARRCAACGQPISGRADRRYCGATCRQRSHRKA